jgi:hypothetical protein
MVETSDSESTQGIGWGSILQGVAVLALMVFLGLSIMKSLMGTPYTGRKEIPFDQRAWLAGMDDEEGSRYLMLNDLLAKQPLVGCTREQVEELLGPLTPPIGANGIWRYYLGPEPSLASVDSVYLGLTFSSEKVVRVLTVTN